MEKDRKSIRIDPKLHKGIEKLSKKENRNISFLVDKAIENYLSVKKIQVE